MKQSLNSKSKSYKKLLFLLLCSTTFNSFAGVKCFIKIGFSDCVNCYNVLSIVEDFDKEYVFKNEYSGIEREILKEYLGITENVVIHTSDSFYNSFGYENYTVLSFCNDSREIFKCPMSGIEKCLPHIEKIKNYKNQVKEEIKLLGYWHKQCQIRLTKSEEIIILDPLLHKLTKLNKKGVLQHTFSSNTSFIEEIYKCKFGDKSTELNSFYTISHSVKNRSVPINFNNVAVYENSIFLMTTGHYFIFDKRDTIYASFSSIVKFDENFNYQIFNFNSEIRPKYFLAQGYFKAINDSTILCDVISTDPRNTPYVLAENTLKGQQMAFRRFYSDTIPNNIVDRRLYYRVTSFTHDSGFIAYSMFNGVYMNSKALPHLNLFENYKFGLEVPSPKNFITGIRKNNDLIYISNQIDSLNFITPYNLKENKLLSPVFSVSSNSLTTFLQLDSPGLIYYVNKEKKLIKTPLLTD